jgi:hypothetical protein
MEIKVGQVWKSNLTDIEYTVEYIHEHSVRVSRLEMVSIDKCAFDGEIFEPIKDVEPQISDLEIVKKALMVSGAEMRMRSDGSFDFRSSGAKIWDGQPQDLQAVVNWAKQTIGHEQ